MKPRWRNGIAGLCAAAGAACVSFDPAGPPVPDITGTYAAIIALALTNEFETRTDTVPAVLELHHTGHRGRFVGRYTIAATDSGPFEGTTFADGTLWLTTFGTPPKPIAGVPHVRGLYPWCDFPLLGMPPVRGSLAGDTLRVSVDGSVPCLYQVEGRTLTLHTRLLVRLTGVR